MLLQKCFLKLQEQHIAGVTRQCIWPHQVHTWNERAKHGHVQANKAVINQHEKKCVIKHIEKVLEVAESGINTAMKHNTLSNYWVLKF